MVARGWRAGGGGRKARQLRSANYIASLTAPHFCYVLDTLLLVLSVQLLLDGGVLHKIYLIGCVPTTVYLVDEVYPDVSPNSLHFTF